MSNDIIKFENGQLERLSNTLEIAKKLIDESTDKLFRYLKKDRYGFVNHNKEFIISCKYDEVGLFSENICPVKINNKWGCIDLKENIIIPFVYEFLGKFNKGLAIVKDNKKFGLINKKGELKFPINYERIHFLQDYKIWTYFKSVDEFFQNEPDGYLDINGDPITVEYIDISPFKLKRSSLSNEVSRVIIQKYNSLFEYGLCPVILNGKYGAIDKIKKLAIDCIYDSIEIFKNGLIKVKLHNQFGIMNTKGENVIPIKYKSIQFFDDELFIVSNELNKDGVIDINENIIIPFVFDSIYHVQEDLAPVEIDFNYGYIDKYGTIVIPCIYEFGLHFKNGLASVKINNKYGFINQLGELVIPAIYDDSSSEFQNDGTCTLLINDYSVTVDKFGNQYWE